MSGSENIAIDYRKTEVYDVLVDQDQIFDSYTQLLIFAAAVGYAHGRFEEDVEEDAQTKWYYIKGDNRWRWRSRRSRTATRAIQTC
jgi:hypothetical protein